MAVPTNAKLHVSEFAYVLENSGARAVFTTKDLSAAIGALNVPTCTHHVEVDSAEYRAFLKHDPLPLVETGAG